jgi:hypothetical protein
MVTVTYDLTRLSELSALSRGIGVLSTCGVIWCFAANFQLVRSQLQTPVKDYLRVQSSGCATSKE